MNMYEITRVGYGRPADQFPEDELFDRLSQLGLSPDCVREAIQMLDQRPGVSVFFQGDHFIIRHV